MAKELIHSANECGVDMVKFQLYDIDTIKKPGDTNYEELKRAQLTRDNMYELYKESKKVEIPFLCSVFDLTRWGWYQELNLKQVKLATRTATMPEIYKPILNSGYFVFASFAPYYDDGWQFASIPSEFSSPDTCLLFCMARRQILQSGMALPQKFGSDQMFQGFSDHTVGLAVAFEAIKRGAIVIEKHFTFDLNMPGWDQPSSANPLMMKDLVDYAKEKDKK